MLTTIRRLLETHGVGLEQTVYTAMRDEILDYPLTVGDFFSCGWGLQQGRSFKEIYDFYRLLLAEEEKNGVPEILEMIEKSNGRMVQVKKEEKGEARKRCLEMIKSAKRGMREAADCLKQLAFETASEKYGGDPTQISFLEYKNRVMVTDYDNIVSLVPPFGETRYEEMRSFPWLTTDLVELGEAVKAGESVGVVGGPCIFGIDEVLIEVQTADGETELFDCSCGRQCTKDPGRPARTLAGYMKEKGEQVQKLHIRNRKQGITGQEFISLLYVFETASLLKGSVVIPLPDMSYQKYMEADLEHLPPRQRASIMEEFIRTADEVADRFLEAIDLLKSHYPDIPVTVLHRRDEALCRLFYEKREPFVSNSSYMRKLTREDHRKESVVDYITMLALPFYIYGTKHVVQLDSLDETDSGRKCQKLHGDCLRLHSILYPEFLSRDGMNTLYNTTIEYKDYLKRGDMERWLEKGRAF